MDEYKFDRGRPSKPGCRASTGFTFILQRISVENGPSFPERKEELIKQNLHRTSRFLPLSSHSLPRLLFIHPAVY